MRVCRGRLGDTIPGACTVGPPGRRLTDTFIDFLAVAGTDPALRALLIQSHNDSGYSPPMPDDLTGDAFLAADHPHVDNMALAASQEVGQEIGRTHAGR